MSVNAIVEMTTAGDRREGECEGMWKREKERYMSKCQFKTRC